MRYSVYIRVQQQYMVLMFYEMQLLPPIGLGDGIACTMTAPLLHCCMHVSVTNCHWHAIVIASDHIWDPVFAKCSFSCSYRE